MAVIMRLRPRGVLAIRMSRASCWSSTLAGLLIVWAALLGSNPARAELLEFSGTLSITHIPFLTAGYPLGTQGSFAHTGSGVGVSSSTPNRVTGFVGVSGFTGTGTSFVNGTFQPPTLWRFRVTGIGSPDFSGAPFSGAPLHGPLAVRGFLSVTNTPNASPLYTDFFTAPLTANGTAGLGLGGTVANLRFGQWTAGLVALQGVATSYSGTRSTTLSRSGFDARTAGGAGSLQLVTPIRIQASSGALDRGGFAVLELQFAPEPDRLLLLGSGATVLALLGARRHQRGGGTRRGLGPRP
jgi:hypothetical protein